MAAASSFPDSTLTMNTVMHLITNRLTSSNYLVWKNQLIPVLTYQNLLSHVDGSSFAPASVITTDDKSIPNPAYVAWLSADQCAVILLQASLTEEAFSEIIGLSTARDIWVALETAFSNSSVERVQNLRDQLCQLSKDLAKAFHAQCHVTTSGPHWFVDSGATEHMTSSTGAVTQSTPYSGTAKVTFGNSNVLLISHIGQSKLSHDIRLRDVLVVPKLTKNLLSISKLTTDNCLDVLFSQPYFYIQDRTTKQVLAQGRCERGLYVLNNNPQASVATSRSTLNGSYELWHSRQYLAELLEEHQKLQPFMQVLPICSILLNHEKSWQRPCDNS